MAPALPAARPAIAPFFRSIPHGRPGRRAVTALLALAILLVATIPAASVSPALAAESVPLPFPGGKSIKIIQGYNGGTHQGRSRFGLDLMLADGETAHAEVVSPVEGTVIYSQPPGIGTGCIGIARGDGEFSVMLCHVVLSRSFGRGEAVARGQSLGTVGPAGTVANNGVPHVHYELHQGRSTNAPVPFAAPDGLALEGVQLDASNTTAVASKRGPLVSSNGRGSTPAAAATVTARSAEKPATVAAASVPSTIRTVQASATTSQTTTAAAGAVRLATVKGTDSCLNVRSRPAADAPIVGCLKEGSEVALKPLAGGADGRWRQTDQGWVSNEFLRRAKAVVAGTGGCLNVREAARASAAKVGCLPDGTAVTIVEGPTSAEGAAWYRIEKAGSLDKGGWVNGQYLD